MRINVNAIVNSCKSMMSQKTSVIARHSVCDSVQGIFHQRNSLSQVSVSPGSSANMSAMRGAAISAMRRVHLQAGIRAIHGVGGQKRTRRFEAMFEQEGQNATQSDVTDKAAISAALTLKKDIIDTLAACIKQQTGQTNSVSKQEARRIFENNLMEVLNKAHWRSIEDTFNFASEQFQSNLIPTGQMKLGLQDIFSASYQNTGICSKSSREVTHAVNLWSSEFAVRKGDKNHTLFTGLRHGVLSPYGLENSMHRRQGALNRAKEVVTAALWLQPEKMARGLRGETVSLQLTSTSLLTPVDFTVLGFPVSNEKTQLIDQMEAWKILSDTRPLVLNVRDKNGDIQPVRVEVDIAAFNFGVNALSLGRLKLGQSISDNNNIAGLKKLLGNDLTPDSPPSGWVGDYLAANPANREQVELLARQIKTILKSEAHHSDGGEPYKAAMRVVLLTHEIGLLPCWNCKSGKDRTGMLDVELKRHLASVYTGAASTEVGMLERPGQLLQQQLLLHSGNLEVQQYNTGVPGNKTLRNNKLVNALIGGLSLRSRVGDDNILKIAKGLFSFM